MFRWLRKQLLKQMQRANAELNEWLRTAPGALVKSHNDDEVYGPRVRFSIIKVANGRLIEVGTYKPTNNPGPDWKMQTYIVKDGELIADVITRLYAIHELEK